VDEKRTEPLPDALDIPKVKDLPAPHFSMRAGKQYVDWNDPHNAAFMPVLQRMRARYGSEREMLKAVTTHWKLPTSSAVQNAYYTGKKTGSPAGKWPSDNGERRSSARKAPKFADVAAASSDAVVAPYGSDGSVLIVATVDGVRRTYIGYPADVTVRGKQG